MAQAIWQQCLACLQDELPSQQFNTWIRPLNVNENGRIIQLVAPNRFVQDWVRDKYFSRIRELVADYATDATQDIELVVASSALSSQSQSSGSVTTASPAAAVFNSTVASPVSSRANSPIIQPLFNGNLSPDRVVQVEGSVRHQSYLNRAFTFSSFVQGKSNQLALAAAKQVAENPGSSYNPLFLYGGVGLGKTHLMHAVGNQILHSDRSKRIVYVHSEKFVSDMVKALQLGAMSEFKEFYRNADALLIDDIQFFAGKEQSQEEFFHTFNALLDRNNQMILTCDKYPKEIDGLEERLKSRLGWGLPVIIEPPELETRAAVLLSKANSMGVALPNDCAIYIAQRIRSNIRELEGALKRVVANSRFSDQEIDIPFVKESLKDLFVISAKMVSIDNIQKTVAEYYNIKLSDLLSKRRSRSITRPRQLAMALTKELTNHSLPEIGEAFNGRDHTTVLHACGKIKELRKEIPSLEEDYRNLNRTLTN